MPSLDEPLLLDVVGQGKAAHVEAVLDVVHRLADGEGLLLLMLLLWNLCVGTATVVGVRVVWCRRCVV